MSWIPSLQAHSRVYPHFHPHPHFSIGLDLLFSLGTVLLIAGLAFVLIRGFRRRSRRGKAPSD